MTMSPLGDRPIKQLSMFRAPFCAQPLPALAFVWLAGVLWKQRRGTMPIPACPTLNLIQKSKVQELELRIMYMLGVLRLPNQYHRNNPPS
jgi:hypothetical protein